jgi:hypothetical protein
MLHRDTTLGVMVGKKVKVPCKRPRRARDGGRGTALLFLYFGARRGGWSAPRPGRFTPGKNPVPIVQEAGWTPGPVWTCVKNLAPTGIRSPDRPARSQSLYSLSYPGHCHGRIRLKLRWWFRGSLVCTTWYTCRILHNIHHRRCDKTELPFPSEKRDLRRLFIIIFMFQTVQRMSGSCAQSSDWYYC